MLGQRGNGDDEGWRAEGCWSEAMTQFSALTGQIQVVPEHELVIGDDASAELSRGSSSAQRRALRVPHVK